MSPNIANCKCKGAPICATYYHCGVDMEPIEGLMAFSSFLLQDIRNPYIHGLPFFVFFLRPPVSSHRSSTTIHSLLCDDYVCDPDGGSHGTWHHIHSNVKMGHSKNGLGVLMVGVDHSAAQWRKRHIHPQFVYYTKGKSFQSRYIRGQLSQQKRPFHTPRTPFDAHPVFIHHRPKIERNNMRTLNNRFSLQQDHGSGQRSL